MNQTRNALLMVILAITFVSYYPALQNDFTNWDDNKHVTENRDVQGLSFENLKSIFTTTVSYVYIPLTLLSYTLEYHFFGYDPFIYHLNNLLLHGGVVALVYFFSLQCGLTLRSAFLAALLFGIHPIHVESVAWITERKDVLYAFFYMAALCVYGKYLKTKQLKFYLICLFLGLLSILSKAMALSLPFILLLLDWFSGRKITFKVLGEKIPFFFYIIPIAWLTYIAKPSLISFNTDWLTGLTIFIWSTTFYLLKFILPVTLIPYYQLPQPVSLLNGHYMGAIVFLIILAVLFICLKNRKWFLFALSFYMTSIFFLLRFNNTHSVGITADRWMYLPCLGLCLWFGYLFDRGLKCLGEKHILMGRLFLISLVGLFVCLSVKTYVQTSVWRNSLTMWSYVIDHDPNIAIAYNNRGLVYSNTHQYDLALEDYSKAIEIDPFHYSALNNRATIYSRNEQYQSAEADYSQSLALNENFQSFYNRGNLYIKLARYEEAIKDFNKAIEIKPRLEKSYNNRGVSQLFLHNFDSALADFNKALELNPVFFESHNNRGLVLNEMGRHREAILACTNALAIKPDHARAYYNRGKAYRLTGQASLAIADLNRAIQLNASLPEAYLNRSLTLSSMRRYDLALADARKAQSLGKENIDAFIEQLNHLVMRNVQEPSHP